MHREPGGAIDWSTMPLPSGDWVKMTFYYGLPEDTAQNVAWWKPATPFPSGFDIQAFADSGNATYFPLWKVTAAAEAKFLGLSVTVRNGGTSLTARSYQNDVGTVSGDMLPNGCAALVAQQTTTSGGSGRGRHFIPGTAASLTDGSYITNAGVTAFTPLVGFFQTPFTYSSTSFVPQVYSHKANALYPVNYARVDRVLAFRRKRQPIF